MRYREDVPESRPASKETCWQKVKQPEEKGAELGNQVPPLQTCAKRRAQCRAKQR